MNTVRATAYITVRALRTRFGRADPETGLRPVIGAKVVNVTQARPQHLNADEVAVTVTLELPAEVYEPIMPAALVVVPADLVQRPVEVVIEGESDA